jgi:hypothetical protein
MFPFITPSIWWTLIAIAFDSFATTLPKRLVLCTVLSASPLCCPADTLHQCTIIIMWHKTTSVIVVNLNVVFMASNTVQLRWRL